MEDDILELKDEIKYLTERVNELEKSNNRRKANTYLKILIKVCFILLFAFGIWRGYEYAKEEVPKLIDEKINDIKSIKIYE